MWHLCPNLEQCSRAVQHSLGNYLGHLGRCWGVIRRDGKHSWVCHYFQDWHPRAPRALLPHLRQSDTKQPNFLHCLMSLGVPPSISQIHQLPSTPWQRQALVVWAPFLWSRGRTAGSPPQNTYLCASAQMRPVLARQTRLINVGAAGGECNQLWEPEL